MFHCFLHLHEAFQDHQMDLIQDSFKLLLMLRILEPVRLCVCSLSRVSVSHSFLALPLALKAKPCGGLSAQSRTTKLGSPVWALDPLLHEENLYSHACPPRCGSPTAVLWVFTINILPLYPSCLSSCDSNLISLVVGNLYASFGVILIDSCSGNSYFWCSHGR